MIPVQVEVSKEHAALLLGKLERKNGNTETKFEVPATRHD